MPRTTRQRTTRSTRDQGNNPTNLRLATPPLGEAAPRVEIDAHFHQLVYEAVRTIPEGRVSSYGRIAHLIGHPKHSRHVGAALKLLPSHLSSPHLPQRPSSNPEEDVLPEPEPNPTFVPWHRVVSSSGQISPRMNDISVRRQAEWLIAEGVEVQDIPEEEEGERRAAARGGGADGDPVGWGMRAANSGGKVRMGVYAWP